MNYPEPMWNYPIVLVSSIVQWFEQVQEDWTTPTPWETTLQARFPQSNFGSSRFRRIELPWTFEKLPYRQGFLGRTVVRAGSERLNYPEPMWNYPIVLVSSIVQWFEQVQDDWTTPNSWETTLLARYPQSNWFEQVQKDWTTPNSWETTLQARFPRSYSSSEGLNYPELVRNYPIGLVSPIVQWFEQVQKDWTNPNPCETTL